MSGLTNRTFVADLPDDWTEKRADFLCFAARKTVEPKLMDAENVWHYSIPNVQEFGTAQLEPAATIESSKILIEGETLLVSKLNPRKKTICIAIPGEEHPTVASSEFVAVQSDEIDQRYALYVWSSEKVTDRLSAIVQSVTRSHQRVNPADITKLPWRWPDLDTQRRIAGYLDDKTARIDALIEKKRALLDRLAEKRQALITRAVTRGLNPSAPLKDSGIDWLGKVPAHWSVEALGYRYQVQLGRMLNAERAEGDNLRPYLRVNDVQWRKISISDLPMMDFPPEAQERYRLEPGDLLINEGGSYVGRSAMWRGELAECYYQKALHRARPLNDERDTAEFLYFIMEMATQRSVFIAGGNQTTIDHLTAEQLRAYRFPFPPLTEQEAIVAFLEPRIQSFEALDEQINRSIERLTEYRAALVTAAVTGKIKALLVEDHKQSAAPMRAIQAS